MEDIKVLAFDTGDTVLDWHAGLTAAFAAWGAAQGIEPDWHALANEHRRRITAGGEWIRTCMGLFLSSGCFGLC